MAAHQAPLSLGFSRQEHWSGLPFPSPKHEGEKWKWSCSVVSDSLRTHGLQPTRLLHPWDFPGKSTGVGCHCQQGINDMRLYVRWVIRAWDSFESPIHVYIIAEAVVWVNDAQGLWIKWEKEKAKDSWELLFISEVSHGIFLMARV